NDDNRRTRKLGRTHQQPCQVQHRKALATACCSEIGSAFSVAFGFAMLQDIRKQFICSVILRITAQYLSLVFGRVGKQYKMMNNIDQSLWIQHAVNDRSRGLDTR